SVYARNSRRIDANGLLQEKKSPVEVGSLRECMALFVRWSISNRVGWPILPTGADCRRGLLWWRDLGGLSKGSLADYLDRPRYLVEDVTKRGELLLLIR